MTKVSFHLQAEDGRARCGSLQTPHGIIETPAYVPVATRGSVKTLSISDLQALSVQALITNAYHLHLQPGLDLIRQTGGLHRFMGWDKPLLIDSGGFQVLSLGLAKEKGGGKVSALNHESGKARGSPFSKAGKNQVTVTKDGLEFISYRDGSRHRFTPEKVVRTGLDIGADIIIVLDECTSPFHDYQATREAMERTHQWALTSLESFHKTTDNRQALFGVVQGGAFRDLREESSRFLGGQPFSGFAIGGFLGGSKKEMIEVLTWTIPHLPRLKPRHFLGIGLVEDIFDMVEQGIDLFDCVAPTRLAATGTLLSKERPRFRMRILNQAYKNDRRPIEEGCTCLTCRTHSRAYLQHLFRAKEPLAGHLAAYHNLHFMETLMHQIRRAVQDGQFQTFKKSWMGGKG
jgi:queuine tRNA-ribosyltransferase/7-cyano-7-deazaguanine tRNA-ribosyltransferase